MKEWVLPEGEGGTLYNKPLSKYRDSYMVSIT